MKIYGKIPHLDGFSKWEKIIWDFFMGKSTILVMELLCKQAILNHSTIKLDQTWIK